MGYYGIQSTSGRYASYLNAFLFLILLHFRDDSDNGLFTPCLTIIAAFALIAFCFNSLITTEVVLVYFFFLTIKTILSSSLRFQ